ncbi:hypothetical protein FRX31_020050, partial [Thalictrum thalictroides]
GAIRVNEKGQSSKKPGKPHTVKKASAAKKTETNISNAIDNLKQHGSFRSCPTSMVSITENMKATLLSSHKEAMLNTSFGQFFSLFLEKKIKKESMANQNRNLLFDIINRYLVEKDALKSLFSSVVTYCCCNSISNHLPSSSLILCSNSFHNHGVPPKTFVASIVSGAAIVAVAVTPQAIGVVASLAILLICFDPRG